MRHDFIVPATCFAVMLALAACNKQDTPVGPSEPTPTTTPNNAQRTTTSTTPSTDTNANKPTTQTQQASANKPEATRDATELINDASATLHTMMADGKLKKLVGRSSGVFIVPHYGRAAAGVGVRGGEGVLLGHRDGKWSDPVFYDIGGISVGPQFGAQGGEIAMVLMGDQALNSFKGDNSFTLNAGANVNVVDYSAATQASLGKGKNDKSAVIFWSNTKGAFAGATLGATNLSWDDAENKAYYGKKVTAQDVLSGKVSDEKEGPLQKALSSV